MTSNPAREDFMAKKKAEPSASGKARAAAIHGEIDKLTGAGAKPRGKAQTTAPIAPRDYIQHWMAEHDKKPKGK
jgi:hypothetical protein